MLWGTTNFLNSEQPTDIHLQNLSENFEFEVEDASLTVLNLCDGNSVEK